MGSGFSKMKKQAKMLQEQMADMKEKMRATEATGTAGNGLVEVTMNGENEVKKIKINPECVTPDDVEGLEDLLISAFHDAKEKIDEACPTPGMGSMGLPF